MEHGIAIICIVLIFAAYMVGRVGYAIEKDKKEKSDYDKMNDSINDAINEEDNQTRNLLIKTLEDIGCQPEIDNDNSIIFKYQGEAFKVNASNDSHIILIYDIAWGQLSLNDPNAELFKQAVNKANEYTPIINLYTIDQEQELITVHCRMALYFSRSIERHHDYLKSILDAFFLAHQCVKDELSKLSNGHEQKERIEIKGFRNN